jgi:hypothetical protein
VALSFDKPEENPNRLFAVTGRRSFLIGSMHGGFPDLGHHLPGEMGGLWAFPVKLADGFWFGISQVDSSGLNWMYGDTCTRTYMRPGEAVREYSLPIDDGAIEAAQQLFAPDEEPGIAIKLTLHNPGATTARFMLLWLVRWDVQGAWWSNWPDRSDEARFEPEWGGIAAWDSQHTEWSGAMASNMLPKSHAIGADLWGPEHTGSLVGEEGAKHGGILPNPEELRGAGISGRLDYEIALEPDETKTLSFAIAGGAQGYAFAREKTTDLLVRNSELWGRKRARQEQLQTAASSIQTPVASLDRTYSLQNLCLDMLTMELPGVAVGVVAGLPSFAWFFGCDTYYSVSGLLVSGQGDAAISTLRLLANYARVQSGRIPHEITPTGRMFNPGNPVETGEFVTSIERAYRWTGDRALLEETYGVCKEGIFEYLLGACDPDGTLLPNGPGLLELTSAGRGKKLDVAATLHQGLRSLEYLATSVGDSETAARAKGIREKVRQSIEEHFWLPEREEYAWRIEEDLSVDRDEPAHTYVMMEMGVLDGGDKRLDNLFSKVEGPEHTGPKGVIHPGTSDFVMPIQNAIVALAELQYGRPDRGLWYLERMAELCGQATPWAIPEFEGAVGGDRACFIQLWSSAAYNWLMVQGWFRLLPDPDKNVVWVRPQLPTEWDSARVENLTVWGRRYNLLIEREGGTITFSATALSGESTHPFRVDPDPVLPAIFS